MLNFLFDPVSLGVEIVMVFHRSCSQNGNDLVSPVNINKSDPTW